MVANKYFATDVRIQVDRDHTVTSRGPYQCIRHPGYVGLFSGMIAVPLVLGTFWALVPSTLAAASLIIRTALEDKTLQDKLKGYKAYTHRTHYRLFPGIW
jgi:protein-S-isoprenylcysteine O-methyltransferase Ste14